MTTRGFQRATIEAAVAKVEKEDGHLMSGGKGLSMFVKVFVEEGGRVVRYDTYANGATFDHLADELKATVPGFSYMETTFD